MGPSKHTDSEFQPGQYLQTSDVSDYRVDSMQFRHETVAMEQQLTQSMEEKKGVQLGGP